jgi:hypothetical protein
MNEQILQVDDMVINSATSGIDKKKLKKWLKKVEKGEIHNIQSYYLCRYSLHLRVNTLLFGFVSLLLCYCVLGYSFAEVFS